MGSLKDIWWWIYLLRKNQCISIACILNEILLVMPLAKRALKFTKYTRMHLQPTQIFFPRKSFYPTPPPLPLYLEAGYLLQNPTMHVLRGTIQSWELSYFHLLLITEMKPCLVGYHNLWDTLLHLILNSIILFNKNISKLITYEMFTKHLFSHLHFPLVQQ